MKILRQTTQKSFQSCPNKVVVSSKRTQTRLGDGFYEQKLIREQVAQLTGRRFLDDNNGEQNANDEAQYQALMTAGIQFAKDYKLIPGVALTAEQMALLTTDIVWLVSKTVTLADGSSTQVLVPQVYALVKPGDIDGSGNLLSAKSIDLKLKGDMVNSGLMAARGNLSIDAANITNLTGTIKGLDVSLLASQDIQSIQGNISAGNTLKIGAGNNVVIKAGNVAAGGNASITAGNDLLILAQDKGRQVSINFGKRDKEGNLIDPNNKDNILNFGTYDQTGTNITVGGSLSMSAGNDFYSEGAQVSAGAGISLHAGSKALSVTAKKGSFYEYSSVVKEKTWGGLGSRTTTDTVNKTDITNTMSNWNGGAGAVSFTAGDSAITVGTNMTGAGGVIIKGGKESSALAAYDIHTNNSSHIVKSNDFGRFMDMFGGGLLFGITPLGAGLTSFKNTDSTDIKTDSTRTALRPTLDGGAGGVSITTNEGGTVNLEAPIIKGASYTVGGGAQTNYIAAIDSKDVSRTTTSRNFLWQSEASSGSKSEVMHLANIQVPANNINFQGTGGISVQIPKGSNLTVQINTLAQQPGNEYLGELAKRSDIDWKQVELVNKTWDYSKSGLTPEAKIIVAIAVSFILPPNFGAGLLGATTPATIAMANAAVTTLATQASIAILNNKGDIGAALKEMGSKDNVKALVTSIATAGILDKIGGEFGLNTNPKTATFGQLLGANLVNSVTSSLISTAVYGGSLEDNLKKAAVTAFINTAGAQGAFGIGNITNDGQELQTAAEKFANKFAHAVLGCGLGAATADSKAGCGAGALGAVAGSLGAELFDPTNSSDPIKKAQAQQFAKLTAAIAVAATGGDANLMNIGGMTAVNAVANNRQLHPKEVNWIIENAVRYAKLKGISLDAAEKALAEQAFRQVQFGAEGGEASWDAEASYFLLANAPKLLLDPNNPNGGTGYMFRASVEQRKNDTMYAAYIGQTSDFYAKNGLNQPTATQVNNAFKNTQDRLNKMSAATIASPVAATLLVGIPTSLAATGATATAINGGMGFVTGGGMDAVGQMLNDGTVKPERVLFSATVGAASGPLGAQTNALGNAAIGAAGNAANTYFSNIWYGSTDSVSEAAGWGFAFGGLGALGGNFIGGVLSSKPSMQGFTPNPKAPALLQAPWKPPSTIPALTNAGTSGVIGGSTFLPDLFKDKK